LRHGYHSVCVRTREIVPGRARGTRNSNNISLGAARSPKWSSSQSFADFHLVHGECCQRASGNRLFSPFPFSAQPVLFHSSPTTPQRKGKSMATQSNLGVCRT